MNVGQTDYRVAGESEPSRKAVCQETGPVCDPLLPARLDRKYMEAPGSPLRRFAIGDIFSIELEQGLIGRTLLEDRFLGHDFGGYGEFAILAKVFEFAQGAEDQQKRFLEAPEYKGSDDPSDVELKLVHYGDDIAENQPFGFSNIPLHPRSRYGGGSIGIQIVVMEVDASNGPVRSLLTTLARFGQKAIPVSSEVSDLIFDLGESLMSGSSEDDRLLDYRFVLSAPTADPTQPQAQFLPGRYVVRRMEDRKRPMDWGALRLDQNTGRLYRRALDGTYSEVRDDLYLTINVRRYPQGTLPEFYAQQNWSTVRQALEKAAEERNAPITAVAATLQQSLAQARSSDLGARVSSRWAAVEASLRAYERSAPHLANGTACPAYDTRRDTAKQDVRDAYRAFRNEYAAALRPAPAKDGVAGEPEWVEAERDVVASMIARYFLPWSPGETLEQTFADAKTLEENYFAKGASGDLLAVALARAEGRFPEVAECPAKS